MKHTAALATKDGVLLKTGNVMTRLRARSQPAAEKNKRSVTRPGETTMVPAIECCEHID